MLPLCVCVFACSSCHNFERTGQSGRGVVFLLPGRQKDAVLLMCSQWNHSRILRGFNIFNYVKKKNIRWFVDGTDPMMSYLDGSV